MYKKDDELLFSEEGLMTLLKALLNVFFSAVKGVLDITVYGSSVVIRQKVSCSQGSIVI